MSARIRAQNKNGVQQGGSVLSKDFLVKGTAPAKKKPICAEMKINA